MTTKSRIQVYCTQKRGDTISSDGINSLIKLREERQDSNLISDAKLLLDVSGIEK